MVKGVGLRRLSCRGSWVQIPPPAPYDRPTYVFKPGYGLCEAVEKFNVLRVVANWDMGDQIKEMYTVLRGLESNVGFNILKLTKRASRTLDDFVQQVLICVSRSVRKGFGFPARRKILEAGEFVVSQTSRHCPKICYDKCFQSMLMVTS